MKKSTVRFIIAMLIINQLTILKRNIDIGFTPFVTVIFVLGIVCDIVLVYIIFKQNEKNKIAKELEEIRYQSEKQQIYYQEMENQRMEMAKIRHDYNNLITSILGLIHMGREKEAEEMLGEVMERMERAEGVAYAESDS